MKLGAYDYLTKPFDDEELLALIRRARGRASAPLARRGAERQAARRGGLGERMIGQSPRCARLIAAGGAASRAANVTVLITGESGHRQGAGRARASTEQSPRRHAAVRGGQLRRDPRDAARERAVRPRARRVHRRAPAQARAASSSRNGGTLFLDEIGEIPLATAGQAAARARGAGGPSALGGTRAVPVDVRIIAATNADLEAGGDGRTLPRRPLLPARRRSRSRCRRCASGARTSATSPSDSSTR